ncbi:MAG: HAMP domain-containing protein [Thiotrichales bacterium]|nr:HAMP domain-containing protein [Thiotrichales bacterium]
MKNLSLKVKLILAMLILALIPFTVISIVTLINTEKSLKSAIEYELVAVRDIKAANLTQYFDTITSQIRLVASNNNTKVAYQAFLDAYNNYPESNDRAQDASLVKGYWRDQFAKKYADENAKEFATDAFFNKLSPKAMQLQNDFIASNPQPLGNKNALVDLNNQTDYATAHSTYHPWFDSYLNEFGYYDIFLVDLQGDVIYSVFKELDYATSLTTGPWANSGLAAAFNKAKTLSAGEVYFTDLALYAPSYDAPAGFAASPIYNNGQIQGVLIFQMPLDRVSSVMSQRSGLGETGESYLIGSDKLMRSDSYLDPQNHSVVNSFRNPQKGIVNTVAANSVLAGKSAVEEIIDYNGNPVISAYTPVKFGDYQWGLLVEMDVAEAFAPVSELEMLVYIIGLIGSLMIIIVGYLVSNSIAKPILALSTHMELVGKNFEFSRTLEATSEDEVGRATQSFNRLLTNTKNALTEVDIVLDKMAAGDLTQRITADLQGDLATLKNSTNRSIENVEGVLHEIQITVSALEKGDFSENVKVIGQGIYGEILSKMNESFLSIKSIIADTNQVMSAMNEGNFSGQINADAKGDFSILKNSVNDSLHNMADVIHSISEVVAAQAAGDLTQELPSGRFKGQLHELKNAINYSSMQVKEVVDIAINTSNIVSSAAHEVSQGAHDLSSRVQEQASALEQTSATMEEMSSQVESNAQNAMSAASLADTMKNQADEGMNVMEKTIEAMGTIEESSKKISEIVSLIDGIAFQTNLLALNAAVEAARAGEHGRGFAVVAGEVRSLAQKSADAAKDIKGLVDETVNRVSQGSTLARNSGETLKEMNLSVGEVGEMLNQISRASKEQSEGLYQVNQAITQIDNVTQQNAALVEETTASAESLSNEAETLKKEMMFFTTGTQYETHAKPSSQNQTRKTIHKSAPAIPSPVKMAENSPKAIAKQPQKATIEPTVSSDDNWSEF